MDKTTPKDVAIAGVLLDVSNKLLKIASHEKLSEVEKKTATKD